MKKTIIGCVFFLGGIILYSAVMITAILSVPINFGGNSDISKLSLAVETNGLQNPLYFSYVFIAIGILFLIAEFISFLIKDNHKNWSNLKK